VRVDLECVDGCWLAMKALLRSRRLLGDRWSSLVGDGGLFGRKLIGPATS
jgi:hypothetical protein